MGRKEVNVIRSADDKVSIADEEDQISCQNYRMRTVIDETKSMIIIKKHYVVN
jgi:hypothetical protein